MDLKISGSGVIGGGTYEEVKISGSAKIEGSVKCESFAVSGAVHGEGQIEAEEDAKVSGSLKLDGGIKAKEVHVSGAVKCHDLSGSEEVHLSGGAEIGGRLSGGDVHVSGGLRVDEGIEAEDFRLSGSMDCKGLINAENVEICLYRSYSTAQAIGGASVTVKVGARTSGTSILSALFNNHLSSAGTLTVKETIEADDVALVNTRCPLVTGARVTIGKGCKIDKVCYSEALEVDPDAEVGETVKL